MQNAEDLWTGRAKVSLNNNDRNIDNADKIRIFKR